MSNSGLVTYTRISPNRTSPRNHAIDRITIHCFVAQVTAKRGCNISRFTKYNRITGASCNYVVGCDGSIGLCTEEKDRSFCSSNKANDHRAITIEVASDTKRPYKVTDKALNALIDLIVDICRRNGKTKILWFGNKKKTLAYNPNPNEMVMTVHRWFALKSCPGDYLYGKHPYIAEQVNARLNGTTATVNTPSAYIFNGADYSKVFDPTYYANKYPDLKSAYGTDTNGLFNHFCTFGMKEGRQASVNFNVIKYKEYYADLREVFGDNLPLYYEHYVVCGYKENRKCI